MMRFEWEDLIGTPFEEGGRFSRGTNGLDCYGLIQEIGIRQGIEYPERQFSNHRDVIGALMSVQMDQWEVCDKEPGAVILFKIKGVACHVGVVVNEFKFLHTWEGSGGVCLERISLWERKIVDFYRLKGV